MSSILTLGDLIKILENIPEEIKHAKLHEWGTLMSWRGDYHCLTLTRDSDELRTISSALLEAKSAVGKYFYGYKGGEYQMELFTPIYGDEYGEYKGDAIVGVAFVLDLENPKHPRAEMVRE